MLLSVTGLPPAEVPGFAPPPRGGFAFVEEVRSSAGETPDGGKRKRDDRKKLGITQYCVYAAAPLKRLHCAADERHEHRKSGELRVPEPIPESFRSVMDAARAGAPWAWRALYAEHAPRVLRYLKARRIPDPEDILGDVFIKIVEKLHTFEGGSDDFGAWAVTIAHRRVIDVARARKRRPAESTSLLDRISEPVGGSVEDEALENVRAEDTRRLLDTLSPDQRDVMLLRILGGLTLEQTAQALGKKVGAVKALQSRAAATIRREIERKAVSL